MKNIFLIFFLALATSSIGQAVTADPGLGAPSLRDVFSGNTVPANLLTNMPVILRLPVRNANFSNGVPASSTEIVIGLGSGLQVDPTFDVTTARLSNYYTWTSSVSGGQVRIVGTQKNVVIPAAFFDSTEFRVRGSALTIGQSAITASITPITATLDDNNQQNNNQSLTYTVVTISALPVNLTQFNVVKNACNIDVDFNTENEVNLSRFEVEVSKNGFDFVKIGEVPARNASRYNASYPITDGIKSANLFVRLKSVDKDATFQYSSVKRIAGTCDARRAFVLSAYPNPIRFGRSLTIANREGSFDGKYSVSLMDASGRTLQVREMQLNNVSNFKFDIGTIASGQYMLKVSNTDQSESSIIRFQKN